MHFLVETNSPPDPALPYRALLKSRINSMSHPCTLPGIPSLAVLIFGVDAGIMFCMQM